MTESEVMGAPTPGASPSAKKGPSQKQLEVTPLRHYGRGTFATLVVLVTVGIVYSLAVNPNFDWSVVGQYVFSPDVLDGLLSTLQLTIVSMIVSLVLSVVIAVMRISPSRIISGVSAGYVFFFRGIPLIVLLILVGNLGLFVKVITIGIPFTNIVWFSAPTGQVVTPFIAGVIGLSLAGSAYMSEIVRAGLLAIGKGQRDAAKALGLNGSKTLRYIVLPQALRVIVPPMGNEFIGMLKASAIVSVIAGGDLLTVTQGIAGANYRTIEMLVVATIWYLLVIVVFSIGQHFLERRTAER